MTEAFHALLLASLGVACEVVFTAALDFPKTRDPRLPGVSYAWMLPIYALLYPGLAVIWPRVAGLAFPLRGAVYALLIVAVEYASGWLLRRALGRCPWEEGYFRARWGVHGLIRLDYLPAWWAAGLLFERAFLALRGYSMSAASL